MKPRYGKPLEHPLMVKRRRAKMTPMQKLEEAREKSAKIRKLLGIKPQSWKG